MFAEDVIGLAVAVNVVVISVAAPQVKTLPATVQVGSVISAATWATVGAVLATAKAEDHADLRAPRTAVFLAFCASALTPVNLGIATAARIPMMTMTITNSINVKPDCLTALLVDCLRIIFS